FVTRNISRKAAKGSGKNIIPSLQTTASNELFSNGRESAAHCSNATFVSSRRWASLSAAATISGATSVQVTEPVGPTVSAIVKEGSPAPPATSSTTSPST